MPNRQNTLRYIMLGMLCSLELCPVHMWPFAVCCFTLYSTVDLRKELILAYLRTCFGNLEASLCITEATGGVL